MRPATVGELRKVLAGLPEDAPIFVNGYEGGFDRPVLAPVRVKTLEPWVESADYCGPWSEARDGGGVPAWVLRRDGR